MLPNVERFDNVDEYNHIIMAKSQLHGVPYVVLKGLISVESGFDPNAKNPNSSAYGLTQVIKSTAESMGYNHASLNNPEIAIDAGARYLGIQVKKFGLSGGIRAYYTGPGTYIKGTQGRLDELSDAQRNHYQTSFRYLSKVMWYTARYVIRDVGTFL